MQPKPARAPGSLHMAAFSRKETQPTQRNNGGYAVMNATNSFYFNFKMDAYTCSSCILWYIKYINLLMCCFFKFCGANEYYQMWYYYNTVWKGLICRGFFSFSSPLQTHLKEIQVAFISVLSDPDGKKNSTYYINFGEHYRFICPPSLVLLVFRVEPGCGI